MGYVLVPCVVLTSPEQCPPPCWLVIIGDYTTEYIGDYNNPIGESLQTNQYHGITIPLIYSYGPSYTSYKY